MIPVVANERLNPVCFRLRLHAPEIVAEARPGQFVQIRRPGGWGLFLPISIYETDDDDLDLLIRIIGDGTAALSELRPGDPVEMLGPLGRGFDLPHGENVLLVSGGIGYAALNLLDIALRDRNEVLWLHGGRTAADVFPADEAWTDDGSLGKQGFVTEGLRRQLEKNRFDRIFACGPMPMMKACAGIAREFGTPLQVSLEAYMGCGIGVCHGCVVGILQPDGKLDYQRVCKEGPVFDAQQVVWE